MDELIYLDHAAGTPVDPRVLSAMLPYFSERFYNPSATYAKALEIRADISAARQRVAFWLGAQSSEIVFTAGGTEANNLAVQGVMNAHPKGNIIVSAIEHDSILEPAKRYDCRIAPVLPDGQIDIKSLLSLIDENTVLVSVMQANNEIGTVQPIHELATELDIVKSERRKANNTAPLYLHTDACQAGNYLDLHAARLGVDFMTINGGKLYGPKQSGILYIKRGLYINPLILGGGQEFNIRSGTENVAASIGLSVALDLVQESRKEETARLKVLQSLFIDRLKELDPRVRINGSLHKRLPNNVHVSFEGLDNERLLIELDSQSILAAAGSACSASNDEPSHVLRAIGISDELARSSLRFTMGHATTKASIESVMNVLARIVQKQV
jgi:cysteine desulfurase